MLAVTHLAIGVVTAIFAQIELSTLFETEAHPDRATVCLGSLPIVPALPLGSGIPSKAVEAPGRIIHWGGLSGGVIGDQGSRGVSGDRQRHDCRDYGVLARGAVAGGQTHTTGRSRSARTIRTRGSEILDPGPDDFHRRCRSAFAVARALQESPTHRFLLILVWAICFVAVGLVSLWAAFADAPPLRRSPVVFVISPLLGVFFAFAANAHSAGWVYVLLTMVLYPMALFGSLLVVRSCGYRLVRAGVASTGPA